MTAPDQVAKTILKPLAGGANGMDPALAAEWNLERQLR
jgi:hypothetical protein